MTKFNPEGKEVMTYGEALGPAMSITEQEDADQYLRDYVAYTQSWLDKEPRNDDKTALDLCKVNLGYFAGYCSHDTRIRVERLFHCQHPIFGNAAEHIPTSAEAFNAGVKLAESKEG